MAVPYVELKDKYGNNINFGHCGDILIPAFPGIEDFRQHKADIREMNLKPNDVLLTGYLKAGTHWHYEIVYMLMNGSAQYTEVEEGADFIELVPIKKGYNPPDSQPRVFSTHLKLHHLPKQVWEKKVKVIYLQRNPKDTWVSLYNHAYGTKSPVGYEGTWDQFFDLLISFGFWYGNWFDYVLDWERDLKTQTEVDIFCSTFEDLKKDPVGQIAKLDQFLGYNRSQELYEQIADACSFPKLKSAKNEMPEEMKKRYFKDDHVGFYRKGEVGDWKNWFTVAQNERFDEVYKKRMAGSDLRYTFEL